MCVCDKMSKSRSNTRDVEWQTQSFFCTLFFALPAPLSKHAHTATFLMPTSRTEAAVAVAVAVSVAVTVGGCVRHEKQIKLTKAATRECQKCLTKDMFWHAHIQTLPRLNAH